VGPSERATLTIDQHRAQYVLEDVVHEVHDACVPQPDANLTVTVRQPTYEFSTEIVCSAALSDANKFIKEPLVKRASQHQDAAKRARAVGDAQEALPPVDGIGFDYDGSVWSLAAHDPARCRKAETQKTIRKNIKSAIQSTTESAAHWTLVEAMWALGACPDRLPALYKNVAALGNPIAAETVKQIMAREPVTLPLKSVPEGVSARAVDGRQVFLDRDGKHVSAYLTDVHHLPGETTLWYCPDQHVFASPLHAETFDEVGMIVSGPAQRGLDRFKTTVTGDTVTVHLKNIIRGSTEHAESPAPAAEATSAATWNTEPGSFCFSAVKNTVTKFG
jgi:Rieske Fe-S protein